jgi:hypothetical protein
LACYLFLAQHRLVDCPVNALVDRCLNDSRSVESLIPYARNARTHSDAQVAHRARLLLTDLEPLAIFLCGPRWQSALARRINRSPRLVRRWVAGDRPISIAASQLIIALVVAKHAEQMAWVRIVYVGMVGSLSPPIADRLMAIDLGPAAPSLEARPA